MSPVLAAFLALVLATLGAVFASIAWRRTRQADCIAAGVTDPRVWSVWRSAVRPLAGVLAPPAGSARDELISKLSQAGRNGRVEIDRFLEEKLIGYIIGFGGGVLLALVIGGPGGMFLLLLGVVVGVLAPTKRLDMIAAERRQAIGMSLPGAVDLLMTCVDAGLSVEQSIKRVSKEFAPSSPILAEEFGLCSRECEAGVSLTEALRRMARRVELDDMSGLCSVISQAHELGAPIVATLADYADSARKVRMAKLEEWAGKLAMKMLFPVALFLLPAALVVMLGPSLVKVMESMQGY